MDLALSQTQEMLRRSARDFLAAQCPSALVRSLEDKGGHSPQLWARMAALGWLGLGIPEEFGGSGGDLLDQMALAEETGRALLPGPLVSSTLAAHLLLNAGSEAPASNLLPAMSRGDFIVVPAVPILSHASSTNTAAPTLQQTQDGYTISGAILFVPFANLAAHLITFATVQPSAQSALALVDARSPGVTISPMVAIAGYPFAKVAFDHVQLPTTGLLAQGLDADQALRRSLDWATLVQCAEMTGRAEMVLEMIVEYSKSRVQFGRPIGAFQAVQHQCADLRLSIDLARILAQRAAVTVVEGGDAAQQVSTAKAAANDASRHSSAAGHGIFAGISFTVSHDMQLYSSLNKLGEAALGTASEHLDHISRLMGL